MSESRNSWERGHANYWFDGFPKSTNAKFSTLPLGRKLKVPGALLKAACYRLLAVCLGLFGKRLAPDLFADLPDPPERLEPATYGKSSEERGAEGADGDHFLTDAQALQFREQGVLGPFTALTPEQAGDLLRQINEYRGSERELQFEAQFGNAGNRIHHNLPLVEDVLRQPVLARKVSSLLGGDGLQVWRVDPFISMKEVPTYWHQAGDFNAGLEDAAVNSKGNRAENMHQITVWIALTDVDEQTGALRFLPGTHQYCVGHEHFAHYEGRHKELLKSAAQHSLALACWTAYSLVARNYGDPFPLGRTIMGPFLDRYAKYYESATSGPITMNMKAGQFVMFTSSTVHASWAAKLRPRSAISCRVTTLDAYFGHGNEVTTSNLTCALHATDVPMLLDETVLCISPDAEFERDGDDIVARDRSGFSGAVGMNDDILELFSIFLEPTTRAQFLEKVDLEEGVELLDGFWSAGLLVAVTDDPTHPLLSRYGERFEHTTAGGDRLRSVIEGVGALSSRAG